MQYDAHCLAYRVQIAVQRALTNGAAFQLLWIKQGKRKGTIH